MTGGPIIGVLFFVLATVAAVLLLVFVMVPIFKAIGWFIAWVFKAIGWLVAHLFEFVGGMIGDALRLVGSIIAMIVLVPMTLLNVVIGRWSAAGHFADSVKREIGVAGSCLYRVLLRRPLKLFMLHGLLEGVEERVPEAMAGAPTTDKPRRRVGKFPGYTIVGSLRGGGSGAKLYVATPDDDARSRSGAMPERVVIKTFALSEGSSLPQIVRESRALECAKQLGQVLDHDMDEHRFYYVMPYHAGDHLGIVTRQLHGRTDGNGLDRPRLATALSYIGDLVRTLSRYHHGGLWHKDVKPENIIIHDGRAHLVDLGLVTPMRSAMTLTTHGTEYFRDPEMVRQALRGVKVHQVNGAKFDIYAAGAVVYFVIENTFPPHGALSRFGRRSPEALRWIVRRAMADYTHRYETADEMLDDLHYVAAAADPFAVRPADLPSLRGHAVDAPDEAVADAADGPALPPPLPAAASPEPLEKPLRPKRPALRVTNWWTGAYAVDDVGSATDVAGGAAQVFQPARPDAAALRAKMRASAVRVRRTAQEQVRTARSRARDARRRARAHRHRAVAERQPSFALVAIGVLALAALVPAVMLARNVGSSRVVHVMTSEPEVAGITTTIKGPSILGGEDPGLPVLLVPTVDELDDRGVRARLEQIVNKHRDEGYDVVISRPMLELGVRDKLLSWQDDRTNDRDDALEEMLEELGLYGLLVVSDAGGRGPLSGRLHGSIVWSERDDAEDRRQLVVVGETPDRPFLLVNDHPVKHDPGISDRLESLVRQFEMRGWDVMVEDEIEATVREAMPAVPLSADEPMPERLRAVLDRLELAGILHAMAGTGDGRPSERLELRVLPALPGANAGDPAEETPPNTVEVNGASGSRRLRMDSLSAFAHAR